MGVLDVNACVNLQCSAGGFLGSLLAKVSPAVSPRLTGARLVDFGPILGSSLNGVDSSEVLPDHDGWSLFLRSNDSNDSLENNDGFVTLTVRLTNNSDYPQSGSPIVEKAKSHLERFCPEQF
jgi:hypothetical protein